MIPEGALRFIAGILLKNRKLSLNFRIRGGLYAESSILHFSSNFSVVKERAL
jgi:hypothetical protein